MGSISTKQYVVFSMGKLFAEDDSIGSEYLFSNKQGDFDDLNDAKQYALKLSKEKAIECAVIDRNGFPQSGNGKGKIMLIAYKDLTLDEKL